jgi:hypothetical protein
VSSGCAVDGATYKEALDNLEVIISEWIETAKALGRSLPEELVRKTELTLNPSLVKSCEERDLLNRRGDWFLHNVHEAINI